MRMKTSWPTLSEAVFACEKCRLCQTRTNVVLGEGDLHAPLMFIGEGPGQQEDLSGRPFVGAAGQLLDRMLAAIGMTREQCICCGDGFNDKTMVEYAGIGVAMGNAQQVVKDVADYVTATCDEDGVVEVIRKFVL